MARSPAGRASIGGSTTPKKEADTDFKTPRKAHNNLRRQQYKRAKRAQQIHAIKADISAAAANNDLAAKKQALARKGGLYRTWQPRRGDSKIAELERVVKAQQEEIEALRRLAQGASGVVSGQDPLVATPVKAQQQAKENAEATVATSIKKEAGHPTLPSVEAVEANETAEDGRAQVEEASEEPAAAADTAPRKSNKTVVRESSADTNAGTPRNIRRSPRKRTVKR
ncbi:unnamed protein product [Discula destructiva]